MFVMLFFAYIYYNFHCFSRKFTLQQNFVYMHREIMNHNTHINHVHLQVLIELPIATVYNNTGLSKMYGPFLINRTLKVHKEVAIL